VQEVFLIANICFLGLGCYFLLLGRRLTREAKKLLKEADLRITQAAILLARQNANAAAMKTTQN
jgi:hypothetical protein